MHRDLVEWAKSVGAVVAQASPAANSAGSSDSSRVRAAVSRGRIDDLEEYASCLKRVEDIYDDPSRAEELETINNLLQEYHLHHRAE
jgi:hypothetical protein